MLLTLKSSFYYLFNIKSNYILFIVLNMLIFKISRFISINIFKKKFIVKLNLHFVFKNLLIFLINVVIIILISFLLINAIIFFFFIDILIIIIIKFIVKYDIYNNLNFYLIILIDFLYLKY